MYHKFILPLLFVIASVMTPTVAYAQSQQQQQLSFEFCSQLGNVGAAMMEDRQRDLPIAVPKAAILQWYLDGDIDKEYADLLLVVLDEAYSFPVQATIAQRSLIVAQFASYVTETCLSA